MLPATVVNRIYTGVGADTASFIIEGFDTAGFEMNTTRATPGSAIADRLAAEFAGHIPRERIDVLVEGCLVDLQGIPVPDLPELGERLARQRLLDLLEGHKSSSPERTNAPAR